MDLHLDLDLGRPLRQQLEQQLRAAIRGGRLQAGTRLPPSRELAGDLGVTRGLVTQVYSQLAAEGYLFARTGAGTRVATAVRTSGPPIAVDAPEMRFDLRVGHPDPEHFPRQLWARHMAAAIRSATANELGYQAVGGLPALRDAVSDYLPRVRAAICRPEHVAITSGVGAGLSHVWNVLRQRGAARIAVESPCYRWHATTIRRAGLEPVPIPVDDHGLRAEDLAAEEVDAVCLTPAHQFPTGVMLNPARREQIIAWARKRDRWIVEDDYDSEYRYDDMTVPAIQRYAPDRVIYAGTVSKSLGPALRMGWLIVPEALSAQVRKDLVDTSDGPGAFDQLALAELITTGALDRHLRKMRVLYRARRAALITALSAAGLNLDPHAAHCGLHLLLTLDPTDNADAVVRRAQAAGLNVSVTSELCIAAELTRPALLLGFAALPADRAVEAVDHLRAALTGASPSPPACSDSNDRSGRSRAEAEATD